MNAKTALYFPLTGIEPAPLTGMMRFFEAIILYRLPLDQPAVHLSQASEAGRLETREVSFIGDPGEISGIIDEFSRTADYFQDPEQLALLRRYQTESKDDDSPSRLMTSIRGQWRDAPRDPDREAEIFLHLEGKLASQQNEINDILRVVNEKESTLGELLGVETDDGDLADFDNMSLPKREPNLAPEQTSPRQTADRLKAWARFYQKFGPHDVPLITDRPEITAALDLNLARIFKPQGLPEGRNTEILEPVIKITLPFSHNLAAQTEAVNCPPEISEFLAKLGSRSWESSEIQSLKDEGAALAAAAMEKTTDGPNVALTAYLLPGKDLKNAFLAGTELAEKQDPYYFSGPVLELLLV